MAPLPNFPLPDAQLPAIRVSAAQHEELRAYLLPMAREVIRDGPSWGRSNVASARAAGWKLVTASDDNSCFLTRSSGRRYRGFGADAAAKRAESREDGGDAAAALQPPPTAGQCFMGHSASPYSLEDVMSSVYCETTEELRVHFRNTYGAACLDCCVLATLEGATLEDPFWYVGIKWLALKSPVKKLVSSREFVFLELSGSHVQSDGRRLLYRVVQSVDIRGYGGQSSYFGLTRGHVEAAFVYWADDARSTPDEPVLHVCTKGRAHLKGSLPLWLVQLYLKRFWNSKRSVRAEAVLQSAQSASGGSSGHAAGDDDAEGGARGVGRKPSRRNLRRQASDDGSSSSDAVPLEMATTWVPNDARSACYVCQKRFQLVRRPKHHCRSCGEVICNDCTSYSKLSVPPVLARSGSTASEPRSTRSDPAGAPPSRASRRLGKAREAYVAVGKVCHRCMDLKSIMHNNSTRLNLTAAYPVRGEAPSVSGKQRGDGRAKDQYESLSASFLSRDAGERDSRRSVGSSSALGGEVVVTRIGRESSLSSSEARAIIEANRADAKCGEAVATAAADFRRQLDAIALDAVAYDDVDDDDDDDDSNVDLEFHPVLANDLPIHELIGDADDGNDMFGSVSLFDPDGLFNLDEGQLDSSSDESESSDDGGDARAATSNDTSVTVEDPWSQHREAAQLPLASLSPSTQSVSTAASPPPSLLRSTSSWSRTTGNANAPTTAGDGLVSLEDVKLAIADHVKLLEVLKREHLNHDAV